MTEIRRHGEYINLEDLEIPDVPTLGHFKNFGHNHLFGITEEVEEEDQPEEALIFNLNAYNYFFPELAEAPSNQLESTPQVIQALKDLGSAMSETGDASSRDSEIPSAYTYLGQFIDHDVTLEAASNDISSAAFATPFFKPIDPTELKKKLKNTRSGSLDLDSVYSPPARLAENGMFILGQVSFPGELPPNKTMNNDLPRKSEGRPIAEIGDLRNDENTVIGQLHVAFLKFHNAVIRELGIDFTAAQKVVRQHYQWIVLNDFLKRICDVSIVDKILTEGNSLYCLLHGDFFMPVEFSAAAYRFGHSMARTKYHFNQSHKNTSLAQLLKFSGSGGDLAGFPSLPADWVIEWERFLPFETSIHNKARRIDTRLTVVLQGLTGPSNEGIFQFLAKRNLLRGYLLSLPTGQALARKILDEQDVLSSEQILENATEAEKAALLSAGLHEKTPLWYYILAEAAIQNDGAKLGKLGSTIVAETIIGLIRRSADSILQEENWRPTLGETFTLEDMIRYAGLGPGQMEG